MTLRVSPNATTLTRFSGDHAYLWRVSITGGSGGTLWLVSVCNEGITDGTRNARMVEPWPVYVSDSGGLLRTSVTLRNYGPWVVQEAVTGNVSYESLAHLRQAKGGFTGRTMTLQRAARWSGVTETADPQYARIVRESHNDPATTTLEIEQRRELELIQVPRDVVDRATFSEPDLIPTEADGSAFPMPFGRFLPYLPDDIYGGMTDPQKAVMQKFGLAPVVSPMFIAERGPLDVKAPYAERISSGLPVPLGIEAFSVLSYVREVGAYATLFGGKTRDRNDNISFPDSATLWNGKAQYAVMNRAPYMQVPLLATKYFGPVGSPTDPEDAEAAIDGRQDTYTTISYSSSSGVSCWQIPSIDLPGRLSYNSRLQANYDPDTESPDPDNFEGPGPAGITAFAIVASSGGTLNVQVQIKVLDPNGSAAQTFLGIPLLSEIQSLTLVEGVPQVITLDVPVSGTDGQLTAHGWGLTKWDKGDFSTSSAEDGDDLDSKLNYSDSVDQVAVGMAHKSSGVGDVRVIAVGFLLSYRSQGKPGGLRTVEAEFWRGGNMERVIIGRPFDDLDDGRRRRRGERGGPGGSARQRGILARNNPYSGDLYFGGRGGYWDDNSGTYTGTANAILRTPVTWAHWIIAGYAGKTITSSGLGSFTQARTDLDIWADWAHRVGFTATWTSDQTITTQTDPDAILAELPGGMPEGSQFLKASNKYGAHVWTPKESSWTKWRSGIPIHPIDMAQSAGGLAFKIHRSDESEIVNHIVIHYDYDVGRGEYRRTATCSYEGSDDGYGRDWAATPGGVAADDICQDSHSRYGIHKEEIDLAGVRDPDIATAIGLSMFWRRALPRRLLEMETTQHAYDLRAWHVFQVHDDLEDVYGMIPAEWPSGTTWSDLWWRVLSVEGDTTMRVTAEWYPTETQIGLGIQVAGAESFGKVLGDLDFIPSEQAP